MFRLGIALPILGASSGATGRNLAPIRRFPGGPLVNPLPRRGPPLVVRAAPGSGIGAEK